MYCVRFVLRLAPVVFVHIVYMIYVCKCGTGGVRGRGTVGSGASITKSEKLIVLTKIERK